MPADLAHRNGPNDPLAAALDRLGEDVDGLTLRTPDRVRARGEARARRRRRVTEGATVLVVVAIATGTAVLSRHAGTPPTGGAPPASSTTATATATGGTIAPTGEPTMSATSRPHEVITVRPVGVGTVPPAYFLPGNAWAGPDLFDGASTTSQEPREFEGSIRRFPCDPDASLTGDVAFVQTTTGTGVMVGTQKVRLLADAATAAQFWQQTDAQLQRCQQLLDAQARDDAAQAPAGEPVRRPTADVREDPTGRTDDPDGSVRIYRTETDYDTGPGSRLVEWVAVVRQGRAVSLIDLLDGLDADHPPVDPAALRRIAGQAADQLAWAQSR